MEWFIRDWLPRFLSDIWGWLVILGPFVSAIDTLLKLLRWIFPPPRASISAASEQGTDARGRQTRGSVWTRRVAPLLGVIMMAAGLAISSHSPLLFLHPSGEIIEAPAPVAPDETNFETLHEIRGAVRGVWDPPTKKIVVYARTNYWHVQPFEEQPLTDISPLGDWSTETHPGKEFAALVVRPGYVPPTGVHNLPPTGGDVIAVIRQEKNGGER